VDYVLQALWRSCRTNLHTADRAVVRDVLQFSSESELDAIGISSKQQLTLCICSPALIFDVGLINLLL
jgi:hypothetical protein